MEADFKIVPKKELLFSDFISPGVCPRASIGSKTFPAAKPRTSQSFAQIEFYKIARNNNETNITVFTWVSLGVGSIK